MGGGVAVWLRTLSLLMGGGGWLWARGYAWRLRLKWQQRDEAGKWLEAVRKGPWRSKIGAGVGIGLGIEGTRDGIRPFRTGQPNRNVAVLTQPGSEV